MKPSLDALTMTLYDLGWVAHDGVNPKMKPWTPGRESSLLAQNFDLEDIGVLVPQDATAPDFDTLMAHAINELTRFAAVDVQEHLHDAMLRLEKCLDKFRVHAQTDEEFAGIVEFEQGVDLFKGMKNMLKTGAKTQVEMRARHNHAAHTAAENYLKNCYLGQTEAASFIASAYVPYKQAVKLNNDTKEKKGAEVQGRVITETLLAALQGTREVLDEYLITPADEVIDFGVSQGVSWELLDAVQQVVGKEESEVAVEFLSLEPTGEVSKPRTSEVVFTPDHKRVAAQAKEVLAKAPQHRSVSISGEVIELRRVHDDPDSQRIRLRATVDGKVRNFVAHLGPEDYDKAQRAHKDSVLLNIMGTVLPGGFEEVEKVIVTNAPVGGDKTLPQEPQTGLF